MTSHTQPQSGVNMSGKMLAMSRGQVHALRMCVQENRTPIVHVTLYDGTAAYIESCSVLGPRIGSHYEKN
jgi:hypothetical protein